MRSPPVKFVVTPANSLSWCANRALRRLALCWRMCFGRHIAEAESVASGMVKIWQAICEQELLLEDCKETMTKNASMLLKLLMRVTPLLRFSCHGPILVSIVWVGPQPQRKKCSLLGNLQSLCFFVKRCVISRWRKRTTWRLLINLMRAPSTNSGVKEICHCTMMVVNGDDAISHFAISLLKCRSP